MRITSSGLVGINENNPTHALHVKGDTSDTIDETKGTLKLQGTTGGNGLIFGTIASSPYTSYIQSAFVADTSLAQYALALNPIGGSVGIGTTSPVAKLHINGTGDLLRLTSTNSSSGGAQIDLMHFSPSPANDDIHGMINFGGYYSGTTQAYGSSIRGVWNGVAAREGQIHFYTRKGSSFTEKARINEDGNFLIGTSSGTRRLDVTGIAGTQTVGFYRPDTSGQVVVVRSDTGGTGTINFRIASSGNVQNTNNSYGAISDVSLKSNITDANSQLQDIMNVRVRSYTLDSTGETHLGVIAQELEEAGMGGLVEIDTEDNLKGVKYSVLYMKAIKALQEAVIRIEALEAAQANTP